jgi:voltage-gated potassium channel
MGAKEDRKYWDRSRIHHVLLAFLLLLMVVQPIAGEIGRLFILLAFAAVLIACIVAVASSKVFLATGLCLGVPAICLALFPGAATTAPAGFFAIATLLFICFVLLERIANHPLVTSASISAALSVYLMLGVVWAQAYRLVEHFLPGSFTGLTGAGVAELQRDLFYYSYVTLTTLGYGDMGPVSAPARSLAITEAVIGQLYLVVLVAGLVGMHLSYRQEQKNVTGSSQPSNNSEV